MEVEDIGVNFTPNKFVGSSKNSGAIDAQKRSREDLLHLFGGREENVQYYLSLKAAVQESWRNGDGSCWCDPRDKAMKERVESMRWKPSIVLKPLDVPESSESDAYGFSTKQTALDDDGDNKENHIKDDTSITPSSIPDLREKEDKSFTCGVNGCSQKFTSLASYESHYHSCHNFVCATCKRTFVSNFLLDIHLQENHDSYFQILCPRIDMYRCLVESCDQKFRTPELRKDHLVTQHKFPASFSFHKPVKSKAQKTQASNSSSLSEQSMESNGHDSPLSSTTSLSPTATSVTHGEMEMEVPHGESSIDQRAQSRGKKGRGAAHSGGGRGKRVPPTICFGRGSQRAFQRQGRGGRGGRGKHWHQLGATEMDTTVDIEKVSMADLTDSLNECF